MKVAIHPNALHYLVSRPCFRAALDGVHKTQPAALSEAVFLEFRKRCRWFVPTHLKFKNKLYSPWYQVLKKSSIFFVFRLKAKAVIADRGCKEEGIRQDREIFSGKGLDSLRLAGHCDPGTGKEQRFVTIADLGKEVWQIELFFRWIKQGGNNPLCLPPPGASEVQGQDLLFSAIDIPSTPAPSL